ncbi:MAG: sodium-dependent phosphate transporter [Clostridia bacterium BRH_c25]|nr:MAG: sodium-dependent phosphate transporter [Clostridia bacterium BRH_c25]
MFISLFAGLGLFLYGMQIMSDALQKTAGDRLKKLLEILTTNKFLGVIVGAAITAVIQSSSATTVMVVGLVNAGIMNLSQAVGVIMGANIGTTMTAQIIAFNFKNVVPYAIIIGALLLLFSKKKSHKQLGELIIGFGILFMGMNMMSDSMKPLKEIPAFTKFMVDLQHNPVLGVLAGLLLTAVIQSSSATIGILQALAMQGLIPIGAALPILFGDNIGTCATALIASIGTNLTARRAAILHVTIKIIGTVIFLIILKPVTTLVGITAVEPARQIANAHTFFNVANTIILLPFSAMLIAFVNKVIPGEDVYDKFALKYLDKRILETPSIAVGQIVKEVVRMGDIARCNVQKSIEAIISGNENLIDEIYNNEKVINELERRIGEYLQAVSNTAIGEEQLKKVGMLFNTIHDVERMGDHAENLAEIAQYKLDNRVSFSSRAIEELKEVYKNVDNAIDSAFLALSNEDIASVNKVDEYERKVDDLRDLFKESHIKRLNKSECNVNAGVLFLDILTNLERVSDHCVNVADVVRAVDKSRLKLDRKTEIGPEKC